MYPRIGFKNDYGIHSNIGPLMTTYKMMSRTINLLIFFGFLLNFCLFGNVNGMPCPENAICDEWIDYHDFGK
jgi:hypothetical protein